MLSELRITRQQAMPAVGRQRMSLGRCPAFPDGIALQQWMLHHTELRGGLKRLSLASAIVPGSVTELGRLGVGPHEPLHVCGGVATVG